MLCRLYRYSFCVLNQRAVSILVKKNSVCQSTPISKLSSNLSTLLSTTQCSNFCVSTDQTLSVKKQSIPDEKLDPGIYKVQEIFQCTELEAAKLYEYFSRRTDFVDLKKINKTVKWLRQMGATEPIIKENCYIVLFPIEQLKQRYAWLSRSKWHQFDDFLPLLAVNENKIKQLHLIQAHTFRNRIYLLNEYFSIEPHVISHYCSKHLFVFEIDLDLLKRKIEMLLDGGMLPNNILRDLNVLTRGENGIQERLEYLKKYELPRVMPWMIKCTEDILRRSIEIRSQRRPEQNKTLEYLAERLHWHGEKAKSIFSKNRFLQSIDHETVAKLLDELLKIFSPEEITANISLLDHSIEHTKIRISELNSLRSESISPQLLKISDKKFKLYIDELKKK